jgi:hypothetical protein
MYLVYSLVRILISMIIKHIFSIVLLLMVLSLCNIQVKLQQNNNSIVRHHI